MEQLTEVVNGTPMAHSKSVSDRFDKQHRDMLVKIRGIIKKAGEFGELNFSLSSYKSEQGKELPCYLMTRDGFSLLAMELSGSKVFQWKIKYIEAFNAMEDALRTTPITMQTINEIVKKAENDKQLASSFGKGLSEYKKIKKNNEEAFNAATDKVQLALGFMR